MTVKLRRKVRGILQTKFGLDVKKYHSGKNAHKAIQPYAPEDFVNLFKKYEHETMVPWSGLFSAYRAVKYIEANNIGGAIIECGVYKGGCSALMIEALVSANRDIYLFDTFAGMSEPTEIDYKGSNNVVAKSAVDVYAAKKADGFVDWCYGPIGLVEETVSKSEYPKNKIHFVKGKVEDTLPDFDCPPIAILRLDTDFYESTKAELRYLYPYLVPGGILIIDDYNAWAGARKATDEFLKEEGHFITHDYNYGALVIMKLPQL